MSRYEIRSLDYHIIDACNLACEWCTHYSNFKQPKNARRLDESRAEWEPWAKIVRPQMFVVLGGEPTLHPELCDFVRMAREVWCDSKIRVITNGFYLERHPGLPDALGDGDLVISLHHRYQDDERRIRSTVAPWIFAGMNVQFWSESGWRKGYQMTNGRPTPFDGEMNQSYDCCIAKNCKVLRDGQIWKCPQLAFASTVGIDWPHFAAYRPLQLDGDHAEFFARQAEPACSHCPAEAQVVTISDPRPTRERPKPVMR